MSDNEQSQACEFCKPWDDGGCDFGCPCDDCESGRRYEAFCTNPYRDDVPDQREAAQALARINRFWEPIR